MAINVFINNKGEQTLNKFKKVPTESLSYLYKKETLPKKEEIKESKPIPSDPAPKPDIKPIPKKEKKISYTELSSKLKAELSEIAVKIGVESGGKKQQLINRIAKKLKIKKSK